MLKITHLGDFQTLTPLGSGEEIPRPSGGNFATARKMFYLGKCFGPRCLGAKLEGHDSEEK